MLIPQLKMHPQGKKQTNKKTQNNSGQCLGLNAKTLEVAGVFHLSPD